MSKDRDIAWNIFCCIELFLLFLICFVYIYSMNLEKEMRADPDVKAYYMSDLYLLEEK